MDKFIKTTDKETAKRLKNEGYDLLNNSNGVWTFVNDEKRTFEQSGKMVFTNKIEV